MNGIELIAAERERQLKSEGWTAEHDDAHDNGELVMAARCYATEPHNRNCHTYSQTIGIRDEKVSVPVLWPWSWEWWKPKDRISDLVRAGALIAAEIDRLQRSTNVTD